MGLPAFDLPTADRGRLTNADLAGASWYLYMARHPGCFVCQAKLADALEHREAIRSLGGDVVLVFNSGVEYTSMWTATSKQRGHIPADLQVVIDPDATLYKSIGTIRGRVFAEATHTVGSLWRARSHVSKWRLTRSDMLRMGADVGVSADGGLAFKHICGDPEDRADPLHVVTALRGAADPAGSPA